MTRMPALYTTEQAALQLLPARFSETAAALPCEIVVSGTVFTDSIPLFVSDDEDATPVTSVTTDVIS